MKYHPIQQKILFDLLFEKSLRFTDLKAIEMESSQFMFHIRQLVSKDLVIKRGSIYQLTDKGKEEANKIDVFTMVTATQAKITTVMCGIREEAGATEYLIYKRLKNPFYGCYGFPTQKVLFGESLEETVKKGMYEETNLSGNPELFAIRHYLILSEEGDLLEDKFMYAFKILNPTGNLQSNIEGDSYWVSESEVKKKVTKPLEEFWELFETLKLKNKHITFKEFVIKTNNF